MSAPFVSPTFNPMDPGQKGQQGLGAQLGVAGSTGVYDPTHGYKTPTPPVGGPPQVMPPQGQPGVVPQPQQRPQMPPMQGGGPRGGQGMPPAGQPPMPQQGQPQHQRPMRPVGGQGQATMEQMQSQIALQHLRGGRGGKPQAPPQTGGMGPMVR